MVHRRKRGGRERGERERKGRVGEREETFSEELSFLRGEKDVENDFLVRIRIVTEQTKIPNS